MRFATILLLVSAYAGFGALSAPNGDRAAKGVEKAIAPVSRSIDAIARNQVKTRDLRTPRTKSKTKTAKRATISQAYAGACQSDADCTNGNICNTRGMCQAAMTCTQTSQCTDMDNSNTPSVCKTSSTSIGGYRGGTTTGTCAYTVGESRAAPTTSSPQGDRYSYSGCYTSYASPVVTNSGATVSTTSASTTPAGCFQYCQNQGYSLAALKSGNMCYCGDKYGSGSSTGGFSSSNSCTSTCTGASQQICGGSNSASVYQNVGQ